MPSVGGRRRPRRRSSTSVTFAPASDAGGEAVYVSNQYPNGLTAREYQVLISRRPELRHIGWVIQRRNPRVFVRGKVRHPDHKTIVLDSWRLVLMNTETQSAAMRHVAFLD